MGFRWGVSCARDLLGKLLRGKREGKGRGELALKRAFDREGDSESVMHGLGSDVGAKQGRRRWPS